MRKIGFPAKPDGFSDGLGVSVGCPYQFVQHAGGVVQPRTDAVPRASIEKDGLGGIAAEYGVFLQFGAGGGCIGLRVEDGDVVGTGGQQFFQPRILFGQPFFFGFPCGLFLARGSFFRQGRGWPVFGMMR